MTPHDHLVAVETMNILPTNRAEVHDKLNLQSGL